MAAAFREGAAEASAGGSGGVAAAGHGGEGSSADGAAEAVASPAAVVVVVGDEDGDEAAVAVGVLLGLGLVGAEAVVYDFVVLVDAALHLWLAAAGEHGESCGGEEWGGDLVGAAHGGWIRVARTG